MAKFIKKILMYGLLIFIVLNGTALLSFYFLKNSNFYKPSFAKNISEKDQLDYIILGSSMGLTTLNTKLIDSLTGFYGVNLSMDDTALPTHYLMLKHFLKQGGDTKRVVLTISPWDISNDSPQIGDNDYRFIPFTSENYVASHFEELKKNNKHPIPLSSYFPIYGLGYYNVELFYPSLISVIKPYYKNRFDDRGNYVYPSSSFEPKKYKSINYNFTINNRYLFKLKKMCDKHEIKLIIYQSPIYKGNYKADLSNKKNFINDMDIFNGNPDLFYDRIHVNKKGREKASKLFIDQFIDI